ncbi:Hypothetical predicted protein [Podarcis lilfordi]|uniref:Uncharacterized protein n=1 Tax=Podarcis lilfordi TaxID=74358 RepID=A0AA35JT96_9SAUR|nr:Hypothetical predicted protein [Podarcis lilfordi]
MRPSSSSSIAGRAGPLELPGTPLRAWIRPVAAMIATQDVAEPVLPRKRFHWQPLRPAERGPKKSGQKPCLPPGDHLARTLLVLLPRYRKSQKQGRQRRLHTIPVPPRGGGAGRRKWRLH